MEITFNKNTIVILVGPTRCGKSTFANKVNETLGKDVKILSSDVYRKQLLGDNTNHNFSFDMLSVSKQAFNILIAELKSYIEFPVNKKLIIVDTRGFDELFREEIIKIAYDNEYLVDIVLFDYKNNSDYLINNPQSEHEIISMDVSKFRRKVLPNLKRNNFNKIIKIKEPNFIKELEVNFETIKNSDPKYMEISDDFPFAIIGDTHECVEELNELILKLPTTSVIVHIGDYLDKGNNTINMINYMYDRVINKKDIMIIGNHENYLYKRLKNEIKPASKEIEDNYFTSLSVLSEHEDIKNKFFEIFEKSIHCLHIQQASQNQSSNIKCRSVFITHAPCDNKYLFKNTNYALKAQRNLFLKNREGNIVDELKFVFQQSSNIHPLHVFGHISHNGNITYKNKVFLDTGCVYGGKLTAILIQNGKIKKVLDVDSKNKTNSVELRNDITSPKQEKKTFNINDYDLDDKDIKLLNKIIKNNVKYISGTMPPAPSSKDELEPIEEAINYYKNNNIEYVSLQPKYMGSRCQFYLDFTDSTKSFAVSRNGYVIKHVEGLNELLKEWSTNKELMPKFFEKYPNCKNIILDGELLPWKAMGDGLISKDFKTYENLVYNENLILNTDKEFQKFEIGVKHNTETRLKLAKEFTEVLNLYIQNNSLEYKPFNILMIDEIPFHIHNPYENFLLINDDNQLLFKLTDNIELAKNYYLDHVVNKHMEGIVVKPILNNDDNFFTVAEYMKVRNDSYLKLIYGYDYQLNYTNFVSDKNISNKLKISIIESNLGRQMLHSNDDEKKEIIVKMISHLKKEKELDPRL